MTLPITTGTCLNRRTKDCPDKTCNGEPENRFLRDCGAFEVPIETQQNKVDAKVETKHENDKISHPSHYISGRKYEPKDVIRDWGLNFNLGSAVKYISRAGRKDDILQDLRKAIQFIEFEIEALEKEKEEHADAP